MSVDSNFCDSKLILDALYASLESVILTHPLNLKKVVSVFASGGHLLLEDLPGTGKTTLAKTLANTCHASFNRIQFTPDLLPSDITGVSIFDAKKQVFRFEQGPVFTHILLADEINRASPRTQSALLEAMSERQVTVDKTLYHLPSPFFVIATQNPIESLGTYPLPEAQLDRFAMRLSLGYMSEDQEVQLLDQPPVIDQNKNSVIPLEMLQSLKQSIDKVHVSREIRTYIVKIVAATRNHPEIDIGASPRASIALMNAAKALSLLEGFDFVRPDAILTLAHDIIGHRLSSSQGVPFSIKDSSAIVRSIINDTHQPR